VTHKLLLADDSVTIQRVVELTFSGEDVQVITVGDGEQAIARIPLERPDIVLADIGMPKRSGYDVAAFVKGRADLSHIPVLLLAGAFEPVDEARAQQVHSDGVLVKPFEPQQVIARVRDLIESSRAASPRPAPAPSPTVLEQRSPAGLPHAAAAVPESRTMVESRERSESNLDDYFDRLDAAFAELGSSESGRHSQARARSEDDFDARDVPTLESLLAVSAAAQSEDQPAPGAARAADLSAYEPVLQHSGTARRAGGTSESVEPAHGRNLVADMFAALFAAEQGEVVVPAAPAPSPMAAASPGVTDGLVDEVTRRVMERLAPDAANELVAQIVSEVAERLIREEIARIKASVAART